MSSLNSNELTDMVLFTNKTYDVETTICQLYVAEGRRTVWFKLNIYGPQYNKWMLIEYHRAYTVYMLKYTGRVNLNLQSPLQQQYCLMTVYMYEFMVNMFKLCRNYIAQVNRRITN